MIRTRIIKGNRHGEHKSENRVEEKYEPERAERKDRFFLCSLTVI